MSESCAIMQPTYLPWVGYFSLISIVDKFVILDDVQFEKQSWQSRNNILSNGKILKLSIPIKNHKISTNIDEIKINNSLNWRKKHLSGIVQNYSKHPYFNSIQNIIEIIAEKDFVKLIDFNIEIISAICKILSIDFSPILSSKFSIQKKRSDKLLAICNILDCNTYISPMGSKDYLESDGALSKGNIRVLYNDYKPRSYTQKNSSGFISHLSIIDLIANVGPVDAKNHIIDYNLIEG